jgi:hypothetical protein
LSEVQVAAYQHVAAQETLRGAVVIQGAERLKFMRNNSKLKEHRTLSLEEQQNEARHEATGKIKRYLDLAEKLFQNDDDSDCSPAAPVFSHHAHR